MMKNPYQVPPFSAGTQKVKVNYFWWSWHPCYPYWSKSCWGGETIDEAWDALNTSAANSLRYYHNKLIKEEDGKFIEVADVPCPNIEAWQEIAKNEKKWRLPSDAKPIDGWNKE